MRDASDRVYNFSAGPAAIPLSVLKEAQEQLLCLPGAGASILEISHRSAVFTGVLEEVEINLRQLLEVPDNYRVLFLQGGGVLQFSMVPMNLLLGKKRPGSYVLTGTWGRKALQEAIKVGSTKTAWSGEEDGFRRVPADSELDVDESSSYLYLTSNETIQGVQFQTTPDVGEVPLVCDASSDFLSRPIPIERYGLLFACAQKNAGAAGLAVVIIRDDLLGRSSEKLASMLDYRRQAEAGSRLNTPPVFAIYLLLLITRWLQKRSGLEAVAERNRRKAAILYGLLDSGAFYTGHADVDSRSHMNVTFRLPSEVLDKRFLESAERRGLCSLKGHRSVGGIRASIYNALPLEAVEALRHFMVEFEKREA